MMCPAHNGYLAERDYGKEVMERYRRSGCCAREPAPVLVVKPMPRRPVDAGWVIDVLRSP
jgi:hypothetical protein